MTIEDQLRDALDDYTARVRPRAGLADEVLRQARRRRSVTGLATAGGTAVAVAAGTLFVVADPLATDSPDLGSVGPAAGGENAGETTPREPAGEVTVPLDPGALPAGAVPAVPYYDGGVVHVGDWEVPFGDVYAFRVLTEVAGGLVGLADPVPVEGAEEQGDHVLWLAARDGEPMELGSGQIYDVGVSADGTRVAWAEHDWSTETEDAGPGRTVVYVADTRTGAVLHELEQTGADGPVGTVKGFLADGRVVLDSATNAPGGIHLWDPAAGTVTPWTDFGFVNALAPGGDVAVLHPGGVEDRPAVVGTATGEAVRELGVREHAGREAFSPDGRHLALIVANPDTPELGAVSPSDPTGADGGGVAALPGTLVVSDVYTGEPVLTLDGGDPGSVVWESDGSLLVEMWAGNRTRASVVRCDLAGRCEAALPEDEARDTGYPLLYTGR